MSAFSGLIVIGSELKKLDDEIAEWSQATFGSDQERGPLNALNHLAKEAKEAAADPTDVTEHADILILHLDAKRRAGFGLLEVIREGLKKMKENRARKWSKPVGNEPIEHVREVE